MMKRRQRPGERGSTLIVTLTVVTVLMLVASAAVSRGTLELEGAGTRRHYAAEIGCIEAARQLVISQLSLGGVSPTNVAIDRTVGNWTIKTGHYDSTTNVGQISFDTFAGNCGTGSGTSSAGSLAGPTTTYNAAAGVNNFMGASVTPGSGGSGGGGSGTTCGVRVPITCSDGAGRMLELEFLVRIAF